MHACEKKNTRIDIATISGNTSINWSCNKCNKKEFRSEDAGGKLVHVGLHNLDVHHKGTSGDNEKCFA